MAANGASKAPTSIEDFLWNLHAVLVAQVNPLSVDDLRNAYMTHLGHKCSIERFLVVGEGGLAVTLKRIPHVVTLYQHGGQQCIRASLGRDTNKEQLMQADTNYRRELVKKNAQAKAANASKAKAKAVVTATAAKAPPPGTAAKAGGSQPPAAGEKRPAPDASPADDAKKARTDPANAATGDKENTLTRMLVQGVVRVLQNRNKASPPKGPLPMTNLEAEFKALWKVPFNLEQAKEKDAISFLQKWPQKVEVYQEGGSWFVKLASKDAKPKADSAAAPNGGNAAAGASSSVPTATKASAVGPAAKAPVATAAKAGAPVGARATPTPKTIEDFLWNLHSVLEAHDGPLPLPELKDFYNKQLGHKFAIESFLVVGEGGIAVTLKRIPHIVTIVNEKSWAALKPTQPAGTTREALIAADQAYRKQLAQRTQAAKAQGVKAVTKPPAPAPADPPASQVRPAEAAPAPEAKKPRPEDAETLARMLIQGITRVLQNRVKEDKGPLPLENLEDEFKALWKVPFQLQQAGETDTVVFLQKWPQKVEVSMVGGKHFVQLAKKDKAKASAAKSGAAAPAPAKSPPPAPEAVATEVPKPVPALKVAETPKISAPAAATDAAESAVPQSLPEVKRMAAGMLKTMQDMCRQQQALISALEGLESTPSH